MNTLHEILEHKRSEVEARKQRVSQGDLEKRPLFLSRRRSLLAALRMTSPAIIAEVKKASPSKGIFREDFDALLIAQDYEKNGAAAISILTDEKFFLGRLEYIEQIRPVVKLPLLCKDFVIDAYQLYEAKSAGADAVLLIASALGRTKLSELVEEAESLDLECLIEVHSKEDLEMIDFGKAKVVGINNRDLTTFETDLNVSATLRKHIPPHVEVVSESGIGSADDVRFLFSLNIRSFLIGEKFMRAESPGIALANLLQSRFGVSA